LPAFSKLLARGGRIFFAVILPHGRGGTHSNKLGGLRAGWLAGKIGHGGWDSQVFPGKEIPPERKGIVVGYVSNLVGLPARGLGRRNRVGISRAPLRGAPRTLIGGPAAFRGGTHVLPSLFRGLSGGPRPPGRSRARLGGVAAGGLRGFRPGQGTAPGRLCAGFSGVPRPKSHLRTEEENDDDVALSHGGGDGRSP